MEISIINLPRDMKTKKEGLIKSAKRKENCGCGIKSATPYYYNKFFKLNQISEASLRIIWDIALLVLWPYQVLL